MGPRDFTHTGKSCFSPNHLKHAIIPNYQGRSLSVPGVANVFAKQIESIVPSHSSASVLEVPECLQRNLEAAGGGGRKVIEGKEVPRPP